MFKGAGDLDAVRRGTGHLDAIAAVAHLNILLPLMPFGRFSNSIYSEKQLGYQEFTR
jgi:hypothetical protein